MRGILTAIAIFILTIGSKLEADGASCLNRSCHASIATAKYLHGPIAAEQAGVHGCVACHVPAGKPCTLNKKGSFKPLAPAYRMCSTCHARGTGTQHSVKKLNCLKCHDPHGSDTNATLKR